MKNAVRTVEIALPDRVTEHGGEEILRVAVVRGGSLMVCRISSLPDPRDWGAVLVDVARHVAHAISIRCERTDDETGEQRQVPMEEVLAELRQTFDEEWSRDTDEIRQLHDA